MARGGASGDTRNHSLLPENWELYRTLATRQHATQRVVRRLGLSPLQPGALLPELAVQLLDVEQEDAMRGLFQGI
jgi:hypothetical protein